ncbi:MAG: DinB family protein [Chloroflexi bacterium]|nr:DinB family protein [Chloroflexota bacterium]
MDTLNSISQGVNKSLDGLSHHEVIWRPGPQSNSIGHILFHMGRFEDTIIQARIQGKPEIWETEKWYTRLNLPADSSGHAYTVETLAAFPVPELSKLLAYLAAARVKTSDYMKNIRPAELDRIISLPRMGDRPVSALIGRLLMHAAEHAGEIAYVRGIQRGLGK